jgi:amino acid adenylation domain-containing protein
MRLDFANIAPAEGRMPEALNEDGGYILYTSGSEGRPKGVPQTSWNISHYVDCYVRTFGIHAGDNVLLLASFGFDAAVLDVYSALCAGACLHIGSVRTSDRQALVERVSSGISIYHSTPSVFKHLFSDSDAGLLAKVRAVVFGGEPVDRSIVQLSERVLGPQCVVANLYGSTEATVSLINCGRVGDGIDHVRMLGGVLDRTNLALVNEAGVSARVYEPGELVVISDHVALGYLNRDDLAAMKFGREPGAAASYRTGDMGYRLPNVLIRFTGRRDGQVKINGIRIECGEIESVLAQCDEVAKAAVVVRRDDGADAAMLVAVVTLKNSLSDDPELAGRLRSFLSPRLPTHMIPSLFLAVEEMTYTSSGKIDRLAIAEQVRHARVDTRRVLAETDSEAALVAVWAKLLKLDPEAIGVTDDFFRLGGHSLLSMSLVSRIRTQLQVEIRVKEVFEHGTIRELARIIDERRGSALLPRIERSERGAEFGLSYAQQRLWFIDQLEQSSAHYNMPAALATQGVFSLEMARRALSRVIERHEILRTVYVERDGGVVQRVQCQVACPLAVIDLSGLEAGEREQRLEALVRDDANTAFDLSRDVMLRASWVRLDDTNGVLVFNMHHIASDGWSMTVLVREFVELYGAFVTGQADPLPALPLQYGDYAQWQQSAMQDALLERQLSYWQAQLSEAPVVHGLPLDRPRQAGSSHRGSWVHGKVEGDVPARLLALARQWQVTPFMVIHAAFSLLLSRHSNSRDIVIGTPVANRTQSELEPLIGFFVNTLVLRTDTGFDTFEEYLSHVRQVNLDAQNNQDVPFEQLVEHCRVPRTTLHGPLVQIMLNMNTQETQSLSLPGVQFLPLDNPDPLSHFDLHVTARVSEAAIELSWLYDRSLFDQSRVERLDGDLRRLLAGIVASPQARLDALAMLSDEEADRLVHGRNRTWEHAVCETPVCALFDEQAQGHRDEVAVVCGQGQLTYGQLQAASRRLAACLQAQGMGPGSRVGVLMEPGCGLLVALLGIQRSGAAYIPLLANQGKGRLESILGDAQAELVLVDPSLMEQLPLANVDVMLMDETVGAADWLVEYANSAVRAAPGPDTTAYVIYTSGSTGTPKGVEILHRGLSDYCAFGLRRYYGQVDGALVVTLPAFDITVPSLYLPLLSGGRVVFMGTQDPLMRLASQLADADAGCWLLRMTPMHVEGLLSLLPEEARAERHVFVIGGESFPPATALALQRRFPGSQIYNHYGPTETVVGCAMFDVSANLQTLGERIPIGRPMDNTVLYVLDEHGGLVPDGVAGELYIGGVGVARGYVNRAELSAEKFVSNPFAVEGAPRLYRSGDVVRWNANGELEYLHRTDGQVKVRGYRIELGEIEQRLLDCPGVASALVALSDEGQEHSRLVAYVVAAGEPSAQDEDELTWSQDLRRKLQASLPDYMVPSAFVRLPHWPLTANGKIDRKALPVPGQAASAQAYVKPETAIERELCQIWEALLKRERISVRDNFFEIGGHSLLAVRMVSEVRSRFQVNMVVRFIFEYPTIRDLASFIAGCAQSSAGAHSRAADNELKEIEF